MKKIAVVSILSLMFLAIALPVSRADENDATGTGMSGTPQEAADLQKTLRSDRLDRIEHSISDLTQTVSALTERVEDLERTVDDYNSQL
jgi:hypothetical protein